MEIKKIQSKKGAFELSIGTIVILVIAMSMLILGLVLVRTIFTGAQYNVELMNKKVKAEINKLLAEDQKAVLHLPDRIAVIGQGKEFGLAFGFTNEGRTQRFKWQTQVDDDNIRKKCGVSDREAEDWITTGGSGSVDIASGDSYYDVVRFNIPNGAVSDISTCIIRYKLIIKQEDGTPYETLPFDLDVK